MQPSHGLLVLATLAFISLSAVQATYYNHYCSLPPALAHGRHSDDDHDDSWHFRVGTVIRYWCDDGYTLQGNNYLTCFYSSSLGSCDWTGTLPTCIPDPSHRYSDDDDDDYDHYGSGDSSDRSNSHSDSSYHGDICCSHLSHITNGYVRYHSVYSGAIAKYYCKKGYILEGKAYRKCLSSGDWSGEEPKCKKRTGCERLISPRYGVVIHSSTEVGSYAKYFCNEGYYLVGVKFRKCEEAGWTDKAPVCKPILCDRLPRFEYGKIRLSHRYRLHSVATHKCFKGYMLKENHGNDTRICQEDGSWSGSPPLCIRNENECPSLDHPDNGYVMFTEGRGVGANVWYTCDPGHRLVGSESRTCGSDLTWSGEVPSCVVAHSPGCEIPARPDYGWVNYRYTTVGSRAWFYCNNGYTRIGPAVCTCSSSGMWEPEIPLCRRYRRW